MARFAEEKPNEHLAQKRKVSALNFLLGLSAAIGKPFFILASYFFIAFLFLIYWIGHSTRIFLTSIGRLTIKIIVLFYKTPRLISSQLKRLPPLKFHLPKLKISIPKFPKISFPQIKINFRIIIIFLIPLTISFLFWLLFIKDLPSPKELATREQEISTKIYDRNGVLLYKIYKNENRTLVPLSQVPPHVRYATLAAEDAEFYNHIGFSIKGIARAFIKNLEKGELSGGSTITQQLVKNALLSPEKTFTRKVKEMILSIEVEFTFNKDQILEMYFNETPYGGTAYGIEEAANLYLGKDVSELSIAEAALLAGLPKSPTKYSPFGANPELALERQKDVLNLMVVNHFITEEQAKTAQEEKLNFAPNEIDIKAPHFVMYVRSLLEEKYGREMVEKGGLEVTTTLDYEIQKMAEGIVANEINKLTPLRVGNGASIVLNPKTGEVLAMVGSKDYFDTKNDGNVNVTTALRQPGSSIKVVNYAYALSHGYTLASILDDSPVTFWVSGLPPYTPKNYDGNYRGKLPLRNAFAESRNVPAVKVLASYGVSKMLEQGKLMGISTWNDPSQYGLSLTLGGGEVKLIDLAQVYATIANGGKKPNITTLLKVVNYKGKVLEENDCRFGQSEDKEENTVFAAEAKQNLADNSEQGCEAKQVIDPRVAFLITDILRDNNARTPAFGASSSLVIPNHPEVAVKTGTSNDLKDNLTVGFNQNFLVAVWVGNNNGTPMARIASGITGAAPIWNKIMTSLLVNKESENWKIPPDLVQLSICPLTGTLACNGCNNRSEWFLKENAPTKACQSEQITKMKEEKEKKTQGQILEPAVQTERFN